MVQKRSHLYTVGACEIQRTLTVSKRTKAN